MVVPLATGVSENDDYQRACGRRETPLQGTDFFGSLPIEVAELAAGDQAHRPDRDLGQDRRESDKKDYHHDGHVQQEVPPREASPDQRRDKSNVCHGRDGLDRESRNEHGDAEEQRIFGRIGKRHDG